MGEIEPGDLRRLAKELVLDVGVHVVLPDAAEHGLVEACLHEVARPDLQVRSAELVDQFRVHHVEKV